MSAQAITREQSERPQPNASGTNYVIGLLFVIYTFNYLDRQIVNILAEPIKRDLLLTDWQLGLISGLAFALFYTILGIPLARWADRPGNDRARLISVSLAAWSAMTAVCGLATNFTQMMLARIGVGVGEAGCSPAAHSLITDIVPPERRATALGIYALGIPIGKLVGMALGGWLAHEYGWRAAFLFVGAPGILLAILSWTTIRDPRKTMKPVADAVQGSFRDAWTFLARTPLFWLVTFGCSLTSFVSLGSAAFLGSFLIRVHDLPVNKAGLWLGLAMGLGGAFGSWLGGFACDRLGRRRPWLHMVLPGIASLAGGALLVVAVFSADVTLVLVFLSCSAILTSFWYGPVFSAVQGAAPQNGRATAAAIHLFVVNALGLGFGPTVIGALSDAYNAGAFGGAALGAAEGLRWAIATAALSTIASAALFFAAARHIQPRGA